MQHWQPAYVGVGSNLDGPRERVLQAFDALAFIPDSRLWARSPLYRTAPQGRTDQPQFVNAVAGLLTQLDASAFHRELQQLQRQLGREPAAQRWGPRVIDLDLLVFGAEQLATAELTVPHPRMAERAFVLYPLADIAAFLEVPGLGQVQQLLQRLPEQGVRRLD